MKIYFSGGTKGGTQGGGAPTTTGPKGSGGTGSAQSGQIDRRK